MPESILIENQIKTIRLVNKTTQMVFSMAVQDCYPNIGIEKDYNATLSAAFGVAKFVAENY